MPGVGVGSGVDVLVGGGTGVLVAVGTGALVSVAEFGCVLSSTSTVVGELLQETTSCDAKMSASMGKKDLRFCTAASRLSVGPVNALKQVVSAWYEIPSILKCQLQTG